MSGKRITALNRESGNGGWKGQRFYVKVGKSVEVDYSEVSLLFSFYSAQ